MGSRHLENPGMIRRSLTRDSSPTSRQLVTLYFCFLFQISTFPTRAGLYLVLGLKGSVLTITVNISWVYATCIRLCFLTSHFPSPTTSLWNRYFNIPILQMMKLTWRHKLLTGRQPKRAELGNKARSHSHQGPWLSTTRFYCFLKLCCLYPPLKRLQRRDAWTAVDISLSFWIWFFFKREKRVHVAGGGEQK